jgi:hypothetical protein
LQSGERNTDDGMGISIGNEGPNLTVRYLQEPTQGHAAPFCRGVSNLAQVVFKTADKRPAEDCRCGIEEP